MMSSDDADEETGSLSVGIRSASKGPKGFAVSSESYSFLLFCVLAISAVALFAGYYAVFLVLILVDGLATLSNSDLMVSIDRSTFFLVLVFLSVAGDSHDLFFLFLEIVLAITALDFSFLLRKIRGTSVEPSVITNRLQSYAYTSVPAFLLSYLLTFLYSSVSGISLPFPLALLAASSTAALFAIYAVSGRFSSRVSSARR